MLNSCIYCSADISSDIFSRRYATPASALARESLEKHLTNESWQLPIEKGNNGLKPHRQRHFITSSSSKPCEPEGHYVQKILHKYRSKYDDPCELLKRSRPKYFQPNNSLICKYVPYEQFNDYAKERKPNHREHSKSEKEQIQIYRAIEKFLMSEDNMKLTGLSTDIKKTYSPKHVSSHDPGLVEKNRLLISTEASTHSKQQKIQSNHLTNLNLKKSSNPRERTEGGRWFTDGQISKKKRRDPSDTRGKIKKQNLRIKLNLHPFRKVRVHPEKSLPELPRKCKQVLLPANKPSKASEKGAKINLLSSADSPHQPESNDYVAVTSKRLPLQQAPNQTPCYNKHTNEAPLLNANSSSVVPQGSVEGHCQPPGLIPDGSPETGPGLTLQAADHRHAHSPFSTEQMEGATHLTLVASSYLPASPENTESGLSASGHPRGMSIKSAEQGAAEPTEHTEQDTSMTRELNQISLSSEHQTQLVGVHKTDTYKEHTVNQNQMLQHAVQQSSNEQLGNEEKTLLTKPQISHQMMESCVMDEGTDIEKILPKTEMYDSALIPQTQSKDNLTFMKTNSVWYQNRLELPKDVGTSLRGQGIWHLPNSSKKDTDRTHALPGDDGTEAPEIKIVGKEEGKMHDKSKSNSSLLIQTRQNTLKSTTKEK